jgi:hypothetical protein
LRSALANFATKKTAHIIFLLYIVSSNYYKENTEYPPWSSASLVVTFFSWVGACWLQRAYYQSQWERYASFYAGPDTIADLFRDIQDGNLYMT